MLSLTLDLKIEWACLWLLITHNRGVVAKTASRVVVLYAGQVVEETFAANLYDHPFHPYTQGLLEGSYIGT
jgi:ABC-type dipeptide/oligopeptide/nickel transport system ATPase component